MKIVAYTDGSCDNNSLWKVGGYASVVSWGDSMSQVINGHEKKTSSARMELMAVQRTFDFCIREFDKKIDLEIFSDAEYVCKAFNEGWLWLWVKKDWVGVKNDDLWKRVLKHLGHRRINSFTITHVKGHAGNWRNEEVDRIAGEARREGLKVYHNKLVY